MNLPATRLNAIMTMGHSMMWAMGVIWLLILILLLLGIGALIKYLFFGRHG